MFLQIPHRTLLLSNFWLIQLFHIYIFRFPIKLHSHLLSVRSRSCTFPFFEGSGQCRQWQFKWSDVPRSGDRQYLIIIPWHNMESRFRHTSYPVPVNRMKANFKQVIDNLHVQTFIFFAGHWNIANTVIFRVDGFKKTDAIIRLDFWNFRHIHTMTSSRLTVINESFRCQKSRNTADNSVSQECDFSWQIVGSYSLISERERASMECWFVF